MTTVRVLVVEDDPVFAKLLQAQLRTLDAPRCEVAREGTLAGALARLAKERFDVVLSDMGLPDSAGAATIDALAKVVGDARLVVLSGSDEAPAGRRFLRKGGIGPADLARAIQEALA